MAKSAPKGPSASQAIRDYCREFPDKPPRDVATEMVARGFTKVTAGYVSTIKSLAKKKESEGDKDSGAKPASGAKSASGDKGGVRRGRKPRVATAASGAKAKPAKPPKSTAGGSDKFSLDILLQAKQLVAKLGGVAQAEKALAALAKLGG